MSEVRAKERYAAGVRGLGHAPEIQPENPTTTRLSGKMLDHVTCSHRKFRETSIPQNPLMLNPKLNP